jgi:glycosyltransferase involved in cell wall biosynthesis
LNIWYISKYASPLKYGFASRHFYLAKEFIRLGHNTTVICSDSNHLVTFPDFRETYNYELVDGVNTWFIRTKKYVGASSASRVLSWLDFEWKLLKWNKEVIEQPNVIIVSSLSLFTILSCYFMKIKYGAKLVFEVRDIWPLTITEISGISSLHPFVLLLSWIEKFGYKKSDVIIGTMPNLKEHVNELLVKARDVYCIPQGVDVELYNNIEELHESYINKYIPIDKFIIGYAGSIGKSNALGTLIEVAIQLEGNDNIHFLIVGDGDSKQELIEKTSNLRNITFAPKVKKTQVITVIKKCDILYDSVINSKLYKYGLSRNKWIDYMYAEKPMLVSYDGFKSMINECQNGYFLHPGNVRELHDKIIELYQMPKEELITLGKKGKKWLLENRRFDKLANEYLNIISNG